MFGLNNLLDSSKDVVENVSIAVSGLSNGQSIPITISQTTDPTQFWINTGVTLASAFGILAVPFLITGHNPFKKSKAIKAFNKITGRPTIIIDHSKSGLFKPSMIDQDTVTDVVNAMTRLNGKDFNLVLNTGGGQVFSAQLLADAMSKYKGKIEIYVPKYSMSGGTLLSFAGTNIHMTEYSSLGMLDAQIGNFMTSGSAEGWNEVVKLKKEKALDNSILHARVGKQVTKSLQDTIYNLVKTKTSNPRNVVDFFTSGEREHIYQVKKQDLIKMGFNNVYSITRQEQKLLCDMVG